MTDQRRMNAIEAMALLLGVCSVNRVHAIKVREENPVPVIERRRTATLDRVEARTNKFIKHRKKERPTIAQKKCDRINRLRHKKGKR